MRSALFEIGNEVHLDGEVAHFVTAIYAKDDGIAGLLELKRLAACLLRSCEVRPSDEPKSYEHPQRAADVLVEQTVIGRLFEFHPRMVEAGRAAVLDLDLALLEKLEPETARYTPLRRFLQRIRSVRDSAGARSHRKSGVATTRLCRLGVARH